MDNQHKKIKGYRELSQEEIDLMNEIKSHGEKTKKLLAKIANSRIDAMNEFKVLSSDQFIESQRSQEEAKTTLQAGIMWLVRSVALPDSF